MRTAIVTALGRREIVRELSSKSRLRESVIHDVLRAWVCRVEDAAERDGDAWSVEIPATLTTSGVAERLELSVGSVQISGETT